MQGLGGINMPTLRLSTTSEKWPMNLTNIDVRILL